MLQTLSLSYMTGMLSRYILHAFFRLSSCLLNGFYFQIIIASSVFSLQHVNLKLAYFIYFSRIIRSVPVLFRPPKKKSILNPLPCGNNCITFYTFAVLTAFITPSQWWCVWALQQQSVSWSQSLAFKPRWENQNALLSVHLWI